MRNEKLENSVYTFIEERIEENYLKLESNKEYKVIKQKYNKAFEKIEEKLANNFKVLDEYKSCEYDLYNLQLQNAYKVGFCDCLKIIVK